MSQRIRFGIIALVVLAHICSQELVSAHERIPILLDTDVGTNIDDAFALGLVLGSYELDLRGVTVVGDDTEKRAMMMCRFLTATGRRHIRVAAGAKPQTSRPITDQSKYYYHPDALFSRTTKPEKQHADDFLFGQIKEQPGKVTLVAIGPLTNVARLIEMHAEAFAQIQRIILMEANLPLDVEAARKVFTAGIPLTIVTSAAGRGLMLNDAQVKAVFSPGTALSRQVETLYQMWDRRNPPLAEALAVTLCFDEQFVKYQDRSLIVDSKGELKETQSRPNARVVAEIKSEEFTNWYVERMTSLMAPDRNPIPLLPTGKMPHRVHVAEDFDNDIERFWWMSGKPETKLLPPGSSRACRGVLTHDFDGLLMVSRKMYSAVIFNPVPGPPMGKNTRLSFRYWLKDTDTVRVQIYSLTNGYHRQLVVKGLPQESWQHATVDMTKARRPDGTGGPLGENERIDDIQFYVDPSAEILIDDIVLYDAATENEQRPFPKRIVFAGVFDTGKRGEHWPGDFEIAPDAGNFWRAAHSIKNEKSGQPWIRLHLRGPRKLGKKTWISFRYRLTGADTLRVKLLNSQTGETQVFDAKHLETNGWAQTVFQFATDKMSEVDEVLFLLPPDADLLVDDVLLFESS